MYPADSGAVTVSDANSEWRLTGNLRVGERVSTIPSFSVGRYGVYGESAVVPAHAVAPYPSRLSAVEGAAIWMPYLTAYGALVDLGRLQAGQVALVDVDAL